MSTEALTAEQITELVRKTIREEAHNLSASFSPPRLSAQSYGAARNYSPTYRGSTCYNSYNERNSNGYRFGGSSSTYNNYKSNMQQIKVMVTFVETATTFWAQVLAPDMIDMTRKLEDSLATLCPGLAPTPRVSRNAVYASKWGEDTWYRCITCGPADADGNLEVLFVDFGNREKRNLSDLVWLTSQTIIQIPFLAYPFRLPNLSTNPEMQNDAIASFNTTDTLQGIVSRSPRSDKYTDIYLFRPLGDSNEPQCQSYNSLMLEKGYARATDGILDNRPLPTFYYMRSLQQKIQHQHTLIREKDYEITQLSLLHVDVAPDEQPLQHTPVKMITATAEKAPTKPSNRTQSAQTDTIDIDPTSNFKELLTGLFSDIEGYSKSINQQSFDREFKRINELYERLSTCTLSNDVVTSKSGVDEAQENLRQAQFRIKTCSDKKNLEEAVLARDVALTRIVTCTNGYIECVANCRLNLTVNTLNEIMEILSDSEDTVGLSNCTTPEEALQRLADIDHVHDDNMTDYQDKCTESLGYLADQFSRISQLIHALATTENPSAAEEQSEALIKILGSVEDDKEYVSGVAGGIVLTRSLLKDFDNYFKCDGSERDSLISSLTSLVYSKAKQDLMYVRPFLEDCTELNQLSLKASSAIENKPDMSAVKEIKNLLKKAKRNVKIAQIDVEENENSDSERDVSETVTESMTELHKLYQREEVELEKLAEYARTTHPELLVEYPQLKNMVNDYKLIRNSWDISDFVMPNSAATINSTKQNIIQGFYGEIDPVYFVEYNLKSLDMSLEDEAINLIKEQLEGCFAIFIDKKRLCAYGATECPPV